MRWRILGLLLLFAALAPVPAFAQSVTNPPAAIQGVTNPSAATAGTIPIPRITVGVDSGTSPSTLAPELQIVALLTILTLAPSLMIMMTSFPRILIVLSFVRSGLGVPQVPPGQVLTSLALFLTLFIMAPVWQDMKTNAIDPYMAQQITQDEALTRAQKPLRAFMFKQTREDTLAVFVGLAKLPRPRNQDDLPLQVLIPAYMVSELKTAFLMGFIILLPFTIIDLVVTNVLMALGMLMLPPPMISLPAKILLFVLVDGWQLVAVSLVKSFS